MKGFLITLIVAVSMAFSGGIFGTRGVTLFGGCTENGIDYSEDRNVGAFSSLSSSGPFNVYYVQSSESKVVVEGKREFVEKVITNVSGKHLSVKLEDGTYRSLVLRVTVYSPELDNINLSGSGSFIEKGAHRTENDIRFTLSGSGNLVAGELSCGSFSARISGSGRIEVDSIKGHDMDFTTSGSGRLRAGTLISDGNVGITFSGSGHGEIDNADIADCLKMRISGSGSIRVNGRAGSVDASTSGSGSMYGNLKYDTIETHISGSGKVRFSNN